MRDTIAAAVMLLFFGFTLYLARRSERPQESKLASVGALTRGIGSFILKSMVIFAKLFSAKNIDAAFNTAFQICVVLVGGALGLVSLAFFGYGAYRGVAMFLTLDPLSILAGLVLFLVSLFVGYWAILGCFWATLRCCAAIRTDDR